MPRSWEALINRHCGKYEGAVRRGEAPRGLDGDGEHRGCRSSSPAGVGLPQGSVCPSIHPSPQCQNRRVKKWRKSKTSHPLLWTGPPCSQTVCSVPPSWSQRKRRPLLPSTGNWEKYGWDRPPSVPTASRCHQEHGDTAVPQQVAPAAECQPCRAT